MYVLVWDHISLIKRLNLRLLFETDVHGEPNSLIQHNVISEDGQLFLASKLEVLNSPVPVCSICTDVLPMLHGGGWGRVLCGRFSRKLAGSYYMRQCV